MSNLSNYSVQQTTIDEQWDDFVYSSSYGTPFMLSVFVSSLDQNFHAYYCYKGKEKVAGVLLAVDSEGRNVTGHHLVIHDGIVYRNWINLNKAQQHSEEFKAQQAIAEFLVTKYGQIRLTLSPKIVDIRAFQWVHYHDDLPMYQASIYYTSELNLENLDAELELESLELYKQASVSRRQEIRYGFKKDVELLEDHDYDAFIEFYRLTMLRQNIEVSSSSIQEMRNLLDNLATKKLITMYAAQDHKGNIGSYAVYLIYKSKAYYLFGANHPDMRASHTGTAVIWQALPALQKKGCTVLDLEGVNSPLRGWFKLSFGGTIVPYFRLAYKNLL